MEAESRQWMVKCPNCGFEQSVWEMGGVRWKAAGSPRWRMKCPNCGQTGWHTVYKKQEKVKEKEKRFNAKAQRRKDAKEIFAMRKILRKNWT